MYNYAAEVGQISATGHGPPTETSPPPALARAPPLDRGKDTRAPCYYDNGQGRKGASFQIITIKDTGTAACAVIPAGDYYDNGRSGKP